jgi:multidrug efflux pump subunit AcrA (membrane-fusion protein)
LSPLEQEQLLEQTRAQIRQHVAEIAELARTSRSGAHFFREFLARVVASLSAQGGAIWAPGESGDFQVVAEVQFATCAYHENERQRRDIHRVLTESLKNRRPYIVGAVAPDVAPAQPSRSADEEIMNTTPYPMFYIPVLTSEQYVAAIVQVWLRAAGDPKTYPTLITFLNSVCVHAANFLKTRQGEAAMARNQDYEQMLRFAGEYVGELDPLKIGRAAVNHFIDLFQANRCSLFHLVSARWRLEFVSNQETIDQRSELVVRLCDLAGRLPVGEQPAALSLDVPEQAQTWEEALDPLGARQVAFVTFQPHPHEGQTGLILLERHAENAPFTPVALRQLTWARQQISRALLAARTYRETPFRRVLHPVARAKGMWKRRQRLRLAAWIGIPAILLALWVLLPWTLHVDGDCVIEPQREVTVAAETTGRIERVLVSEGQYVEQGALLAKLEDEDLRTQIAVDLQDISKWQAEANRFQTAGDDAQRKVSEINLLGAQAKLDRLHFLQGRTELHAPMSGIVLTKNLADRVGETLEIGKSFCEIAAADAYEVQIDLRQQDLGVLSDALQQRGSLPVDFILFAHTGLRLHTDVRGLQAISETAHLKPGGSFFTVRADFPVDSALAASLKPGYTGKAKINLGKRRLAGVMMRNFLDYWRVEWSF